MRKYITFDEAVSLLPNEEYIHTFYNTSFGLMGADWSKAEILDKLQKSEIIELTGETARSMGHGMCAYNKDTKYQKDILFIQTDEEKLLAFDESEVKHLDDESDALIADIDFRDKEISELQAKNEILKESRDRWKQIAEDFDKASRDTEKEIEGLQAENERLKPFEDKIAEFKSHVRVEDMLVFANSLGEWLEFCDNLKAEAYKECIEKVKENSNKMELVCSGALVRTDYTITKEKLDNILNELVGE